MLKTLDSSLFNDSFIGLVEYLEKKKLLTFMDEIITSQTVTPEKFLVLLMWENNTSPRVSSFYLYIQHDGQSSDYQEIRSRKRRRSENLDDSERSSCYLTSLHSGLIMTFPICCFPSSF